ncbi:hypothetical protein LTR49_022514 [Elasticomyces elasticus]|nr:hypothetical protein LTR49_022514 [Elasticomyces elasticus]
MASLPVLDLPGIRKAYSIIRAQTYRTPVHEFPEMSRTVQDAVFGSDHDGHAGNSMLEVLFKCENMQKAGSFKFQGAYHFLSHLDEKSLRAGVVSYSTGNHAIALATAARSISQIKGFPIPVHILMTWTASQAKINAVRDLGATVLLHGPTLVECIQLANEMQLVTGATLVPQGHPIIALGQGTVMLELYEQMEELGHVTLDAIIIPSAGAGLLAGTAVVCRDSDSRTAVFGSEPTTGGANLALARLQGKNITILDGTTIADGLRLTTALCTWHYVKDATLVQDVYQVADQEIREALSLIANQMNLVVEPSSAVPLAALLFSSDLQHALRAMYRGTPLRVGVVLTGGNISSDALRQLSYNED